MPARRVVLATSAADYLPQGGRLSIARLRGAASGCRGCDLFKAATQTVFGEGRRSAPFFLVGEQPGDQEDLQGRPFVGPAGKLLWRALEEAGIERPEVYLTNAVKHFKFVWRGKRRIHSKPVLTEIAACRPWLETELAVVRPKVIVLLGASAVRSILGPKYRLTHERGRFVNDPRWVAPITATVHPSSILRAPDEQARREAYGAFVADLVQVRRAAG